jgi:hypothetical protein
VVRQRLTRLVWVPASAATGVAAAFAARTYMNYQGLASDPAPVQLWVWTAVFASSVAQRAWGDLTSGPQPDQADAKDLAGLRNTHPDTGKLVPVDIPNGESGFKHRREYIYLPPVWFTGTMTRQRTCRTAIRTA